MNKNIDIHTLSELNLDLCSFEKPELVQGIKKSKIKYDGSNILLIQTPKLNLNYSNDDFFELMINKNKQKQKQFYNVVSLLENIATSTIVNNSKEWFNRQLNKIQVESMFRSSLNCPLEADGQFIFRIYKNKNIKITSGFPVVCLIKIEGIVFGSTSARLDMTVFNAKIDDVSKMPVSENDLNMQKSIANSTKFDDTLSLAPDHFHSSDITMGNFTSSKICSLKQPELSAIKETTEGTAEGTAEGTVEVPTEVPTEVLAEVPAEVPTEVPAEVQQSIETDRQSVSTTSSSLRSIKMELMEAIMENNFSKVQELSNLIAKLK
jgi:hypothetical protein